MVTGMPTDEERFRALLEHGHDVVLFSDPDGVIAWASASLTRVLGWSLDELRGRHLSELVHPDDVPAAGRWRESILGSEEFPSPSGGTSDPLRLRHQDGAFTWCTVSAVRTRDSDGRVTGISALIHDVDALMSAHLRVEQREAQLAAVIDAQVDPHVVYRAVRDGAGHVVDFTFAHVNDAAAAFEGRSVDDLRSRTILEVESDHAEAVSDIDDCRAVLETGEPMTWDGVEATGYRDDRGRPRLLDIRISKVGHDLVSYSFRDVTEQHVAVEEMEAASSLMRAVFDTMLEPHAVFRAVRREDGRIVDFVYEQVNEAAAAFEGYPRQELEGATIRQLYRDPVEAAKDIADCITVLETARPLMANDVPSNNYTDGESRPVVTDIRIVPVDGDRVSYAWRDVTGRRRAQERVEESERRFRLLAENMSDVVLLVNEGTVEWISPSVTAVAGWLPDEVVGTGPADLVHPDDLDRLLAAWLPAEDLLPRMRYRLRSKDGTYHWVDAEGRVAVNSEGRRISIVSTRMVDSEVAALEALQELAQHDELTGLVNRHEVFRQIERSISGPARTGTRLAMLFCDLDGFKDVNDRLGHIAGDELLRAVARRLQRAVRSGDVVARIGGDELLVVLNGVRDLDDAVSIAEKLRAEVRRPTPVSGGMVTVSASVGVAMAEPGEGVDDIVARADGAMYDAKRSGKDRVVAIRSDAQPG